MSHDEVQSLKEWMTSLSADVKSIQAQGAKTLELVYKIDGAGCQKAPSHEKVDDDHEARLRVVEAWITETRGRVVGTVASISVAAGVLGWAVDKAVSFVMSK